ncbi:hypothetical protein ERUR111494_02980 [Erysipelothrix urinaevulpis]|uniref:hypothetical protein n=1 Tax=Erysipelothrix urinaevulpis TaxID=2683717 RepID=UPI00135A4742|nr:hypothetical protein [Erysipelothrix urinaevulpis]
MVHILVKLILLALLVIVSYKISRAKKTDPSIELKLNLRSWVELFVVVALDLFVLVSKANEANSFKLMILGQVMIVVTFLHTRRYVFVGKNMIYLLEHMFLTKHVSHVRYEKGKLMLAIQGTEVKVRLPLADVEYIQERFSGKRYQKK